MDSRYSLDARIFKAFCDENRLKILERLRYGENCACALGDGLGIGQSALSYHMKILVEAGVVTARQEGKWTHYNISETGSAYALNLLHEIITSCDMQQEAACCGK